MIKYSIAKQYTDIPGPRYENEGKFSGEDFRKTVLVDLLSQAKNNNVKVEINLDGGYGYPTSFLEESFGGLVRDTKETRILDYFCFVSDEEPALIDEIKHYIKDAIDKLK